MTDDISPAVFFANIHNRVCNIKTIRQQADTRLWESLLDFRCKALEGLKLRIFFFFFFAQIVAVLTGFSICSEAIDYAIPLAVISFASSTL
jgi:hypothetical protein